MNMPRRIAQASSDLMLANSREEVLRSAGYSVGTFTTPSELIFACLNRQYDLLLLGHSLESVSRLEMRNAFRAQNPTSPIVQLATANEAVDECDYLFDVQKGPQELLRLLAEILKPDDVVLQASA